MTKKLNEDTLTEQPVIEWLKEIDPGVKAIVSSGYSNDSVMSDYGRYGFSGVVVKPFQIEELVGELQKAIGGP